MKCDKTQPSSCEKQNQTKEMRTFPELVVKIFQYLYGKHPENLKQFWIFICVWWRWK